MRRVLFLALALLLAVASVHADTERQLRGVRPRDVERYRASTFQCLNGAGSVPSSQINDEYCDCADGSDEPGTSACANSQFFCKNTGAKARVLPSSRVDDGICDCCDGSDESVAYSQVSCPNTCEESGRAAREALARNLAQAEAGLAARATLVAKANETLQEKRAKLTHYEKVMTERKAALEQARIVKDEQETIERAERDRRAAEKAAAAPAAPVPAADAPQEGAVASDDAAAAATPAEVPAATSDAAAADATAAAAPEDPVANAEVPATSFPYPAEYAYKAPEEAAAAPAAAAEESAAASFPYPAEYAYKAPEADAGAAAPAAAADNAEELDSEDAGDQDEPLAASIAAGTDATPAAEPAAEPEEEQEYVHAAAESAREAFSTLDAKVTKLQTKMSALQKTLDASYGPSGEFMHMDGACYPLGIKQYTYEVCPYGKAAQKEGSSSTSLGTWESIAQRPDGRWVMKFAHGQQCWQGPQRSLTVVLECGETDAPLTVDEPSKCVYEMRMQTPAVCDEAHKTSLHQTAAVDNDAHDEL